jgi:O-antigen biosynthesis protein WbqV
MIRLSGKEPGTDVAVEFVGARPGEKLHEELVGEDEVVSPSSHEAIMLVTREPTDPAWLDAELAGLARLVEAGDTLEAVGALNRIVRRPRPGRVAEPSTAERETV